MESLAEGIFKFHEGRSCCGKLVFWGFYQQAFGGKVASIFEIERSCRLYQEPLKAPPVTGSGTQEAHGSFRN